MDNIDTVPAVKLFVDFDGTVTQTDVGDTIFENFLLPELQEQNWHEWIINEWKAGRMSSEECLDRECENTVVTVDEFNGVLDRISLTPGFPDTVRYCGDTGIPLMILSDGFDYYIEYILEKHGIEDVAYRANHLYFKDNGRLGVTFPHQEKGCGRCGNCKRRHMKKRSQNGELILYAGDGYSDRYAIHEADVVFARFELAEYCDTKNLNYIPFKDFHDILAFVKNIVRKPHYEIQKP
ncbi:2-hydroxy-3-keto-5-methylthiopentenyl-1-phosphate phosphatase [subsurface metagenome]